ncbi:hypothetical protein A1O7_08876 [Cladophialophora yegresii CBS 114405]|uniref:Uncharacterized protein n=1 Tax=Cladophialophora yegresii CBS 114405 TaxID=1182544 RepID=W9VSG8_9EURO|nr:uncharacterized protein A1O7_08876 [Cladophialophora yegresii CBS 114405]EXJ55945.1 hypothetical protein A1O7_08876 [Cladophialophora yegresii CBS 114405]
MSEHADERPVKQRKGHSQPLPEEIQVPEDDDASSTTSSSSSEILMPIRHAQLSRRVIAPPGEHENSTEEEDVGAEDEEETTTSSESGDTEEESASEGEPSDEEEAVHGEETTAPPFTRGAVLQPDLKSRLQAFLPQLQQANAELERSGASHDRRIDQISDDAEQYIEMDLGLGVLAEQEGETPGVKIPRAEAMGDESSDSEEMRVRVNPLQDQSQKSK